MSKRVTVFSCKGGKNVCLTKRSDHSTLAPTPPPTHGDVTFELLAWHALLYEACHCMHDTLSLPALCAEFALGRQHLPDNAHYQVMLRPPA